MDDKLLKVKVMFDSVKGMREEISTLFEGLDGRISKLCEVYNEFIRNTKSIKTPDVKAFIFSLDSFYFQNSLLKREYRYLKEYYNIIINRMYGEYYKLYRLITEYIEKSHIDRKLNEVLKNKSYPKYDDLDEEKYYDFNLIVKLNEDIINVIGYLINMLRDKETALKTFVANQSYGLNVNNFVSTFNYEVIVLNEQINLYEKYLDFFYHVHEKLLKRLITKISLLEAQLNADIKFEGGLIGKKPDNNTLMNDMNIQGLNKKTARDLRRSIIGQASPSNISSTSSATSSIDTTDDLVSFDHIPNNTPVLEIIEQGTQQNFTSISSKINVSLAGQLFGSHDDISDKEDEEQENEQEEAEENEQEEEEDELEEEAEEQQDEQPDELEEEGEQIEEGAEEQQDELEEEPTADQDQEEPSADQDQEEPAADQDQEEPAADQDQEEPSADTVDKMN